MNTENRKKIFFLLPTLAGGGAERIVLTLIKYLDKEKFECTLLLIKKEGQYLDVADKVKIIDLKIKNGFVKKLRFLKLINILHKYSPDILFSSMVGVNSVCTAISVFFPSKTKLIIRETGVLSIHTVPTFYKWLTKKTINRADKVIAQSSDIMSDLIENFNLSSSRVVKINNPIDYNYILQQKKKKTENLLPNNKINIVSIGRFTYQKGFDILINVFSSIENVEDYHLTIIGEGDLRTYYMDLIKSRQQENNITLLGFTKNPYVFLDEADIFVSSSRWEGFPNVVIESLACGTPVLANHYKGGINEIINDSNGVICNLGDLNSFTKSLEYMKDKKWDKEIIKNHALARWGHENIIQEYDKIFSTE